jgi:hypothetical protein
MKLGINEPFDSDDDDFHFEESPTKVNTKKPAEPTNANTEQQQQQQHNINNNNEGADTHAVQIPENNSQNISQNSKGISDSTTTPTIAPTTPSISLLTASTNDPSKDISLNNIDKASNINPIYKSVDNTDTSHNIMNPNPVTDPPPTTSISTTTENDQQQKPDLNKSEVKEQDIEDLEMKYLNALMQAAPVKK